MPQGVINYADPSIRRRLRWGRLLAILLIVSAGWVVVRQAVQPVINHVLPPRVVDVRVIYFGPGETGAAVHAKGLPETSLLAPIAKQQNVSLQTLKRHLTVTAEGDRQLVIEYAGKTPTEAAAVTQAVSAAYVTANGPTWSISPRFVFNPNRPSVWAKVADYGLVAVNAVLLVLLINARFVQRQVWKDA